MVDVVLARVNRRLESDTSFEVSATAVSVPWVMNIVPPVSQIVVVLFVDVGIVSTKVLLVFPMVGVTVEDAVETSEDIRLTAKRMFSSKISVARSLPRTVKAE